MITFLYVVKDGIEIDEVMLNNYDHDEVKEIAFELIDKYGDVEVVRSNQRTNRRIKPYEALEVGT